MNSKYLDFEKKNPSLQDKIEALIGILAPDPKAITLWSMKPGVYYSETELYLTARDFAGGDFPVTNGSVWTYCNGNPGRNDGYLCRIGAVVKGENAQQEVTYAKTPVGEDIMDAIIARAVMLSEKLKSKYKSMHRIFGKRGFPAYKVIKLLAQNPRKEFRVIDIKEETGLSQGVLSYTLNSLGDAEIIDFISPQRDRKGKTTKGWAGYKLIDKRSLFVEDFEGLYNELKKTNPRCTKLDLEGLCKVN